MTSIPESPWNARRPRYHLVENGAETEDVGTMIDRFAAHLFGRHITGSAQHGADEVRSGIGQRLVGGGRLFTICFASPKSRTLTRSSRKTKMFSGLRSR